MTVLSTNKVVPFLMQSNLALTVTFADVQKPVLAITAPLTGTRYGNNSIIVKGKAADNGPVADIWLRVNSSGWSLAIGQTNWTANVALDAGTNIIQAYAVDAGGNKSATNSLILLPPTWVGVDDFSGNTINTGLWMIYQSSIGSMISKAANGHASYIVPISSSDEQQSFMVWKGSPPASNNWTAEITAHNSAPWSTSGSSQLQLYVVSANDLSLSQGYRISLSHEPQGLMINAGSGGAGNYILTSAGDAHLRLTYNATTRILQSWCTTNAVTTNWTMLEERSIDLIMPMLSETNQFLIGVFGNCYYGPVSEWQLYADDFSLVNDALVPPQNAVPFYNNLAINSISSPFKASVANSSSSLLKIELSNTKLDLAVGYFQIQVSGCAGKAVVIESSSDLIFWHSIQTNTVTTEVISVNVPINDTPTQFYRALSIP